MGGESIQEMLKREVTPELYREIRDLWKKHSIAEDERDIPGLMATLTEDCVYELPQSGQVWKGHEGATRFYTELLRAFPDIRFDLEKIVIGPQGVAELARATGTHEEDWLGYPASGKSLAFRVVIFFPWDPEKKKFRGETVYVDSFESLLATRG